MALSKPVQVLAVVLISFIAASCARDLPRHTLGDETMHTSAYQLDSGDQVRITVFEQDSISGDYRLDGAGMVMVPLAGNVRAKGLTSAALARAIEVQLADGYLRDPDVSVELIEARPFFIHGEISRPGAYAFRPGISIEQAVAISGGFTNVANKREFLVERNAIAEDGTQQLNTFRLGLRDNVLPGDVIYVRERLF